MSRRSKGRTKLPAVLCGLIMSTFVPVSFASEVDLLKQEIMLLNQKLATVEKRLATLEPAIQAPAYFPPAEGEKKGLLTIAQDIEMGGYVDVQYNQNFTNSGDVIAGGNTGRIFDNNRDSFTVNAVELNFTKLANPEGGAGFRVDIAYGEDSSVVNADGDGDTVNLQQAYIEYNAPLSFFRTDGYQWLPTAINFKAGRMVTLAGNEVIEGPDNWNISRSFAFGLTIPFVHTGIRSNFKMFEDFLDVYLGLNNGWDNPVDNNTYKTLESGLGYSPIKNVNVFHALYWGPETDATNAHKRFLLTNVVGWDVTDKLALKGEFNYGNQRREVTLDFENIDWYSYNLYGRYQLTDKLAFAYRAELFRDTKSFRSGLDSTLWDHTLTAEYAFGDNILGRLEWRFDKAEHLDAFQGDSSQQTLGAQLIYLI